MQVGVHHHGLAVERQLHRPHPTDDRPFECGTLCQAAEAGENAGAGTAQVIHRHVGNGKGREGGTDAGIGGEGLLEARHHTGILATGAEGGADRAEPGLAGAGEQRLDVEAFRLLAPAADAQDLRRALANALTELAVRFGQPQVGVAQGRALALLVRPHL